tara:strand:+ start:606 stop:1115 length:510 start_codon:yes stop_codon:yes gene_type:complete
MHSDEKKRLKLLVYFRTQLIKFLDELIGQFPKRGEFIFLRIFINDQIPVEIVVGRFIVEVLPYKYLVKNKDANILLNSDIITDALIGNSATDSDRKENLQMADSFKKLWLDDSLTDDDRETIWKWFNLFVQIAEKYYKTYGCLPGWEVDIEHATKIINKKYNIEIKDSY